MVTLESSLAAVKIALTQFGSTASAPVNQASAVLSTSMSTSASGAGAFGVLNLSQTSTKSLDMQRQLDSAYQSQAMLEVADKANATMTTRLKDLRKIAVQASSDSLAQSERAFLISQFDGVRHSLLSQTQNTRWDGTRLFDGTGGSKRDGTLSFVVGSGASGRLDIALPNLRADAARMSGVRAIQGSLGPGAREQQSISLDGTSLAYTSGALSVGDVTLNSGTLGTQGSLSELITGLSSDASYADAPFTIADNGSGAMALTWKNTGTISSTAQLQLNADAQAVSEEEITDASDSVMLSAVQTTAGSASSVSNGTQEVQRIAVRSSALSGRNVQLRVGDFTLFSGPLDSRANTNQLADALKANPRYDAAPFTIAQDKPGYLTVTWKTAGSVGQLAALEVQPDNPLVSVMKRGGVTSAQSAKSMMAAIDLSLQTLSTLGNDLGMAGVKLAAAVQTLSVNKASASAPSGQQSGQAYANAITSMLRTQIADNASQAALAQANYTPQAVINTLS